MDLDHERVPTGQPPDPAGVRPAAGRPPAEPGGSLLDELRAALVATAPTWLPKQRWFAGKGRDIAGIEVVDDRLVTIDPEAVPPAPSPAHEAAAVAEPAHEGPPPRLWHAVAAVRYVDGGVETYQLLVGLRDEPLPRLEFARLDLGSPGWTYAALADAEIVRRLLVSVSSDEDLGGLTARRLAPVEVHARSTVRSLGVEQSNSSVVVDERLLLKVFRRLEPGLNPDLEVTRALAEVGCEHIVPPLGWVEGTVPDADGVRVTTTLALVQPFLASATEGWRLAMTSLRDLYAEADLYADEVGGDFAAEAHRLGTATALVHADLARALGAERADSELVGRLVAGMQERLLAAAVAAPALTAWQERLAEAFEAARVEARTHPLVLHRIHGDLHLAQVVRTERGWLLLDFEGEPIKTLEERRAPGSPLQDVAGMLRSFDYAANIQLADVGEDPQLRHRADEWVGRNRTAFCEGYAQAGAVDPRDTPALLRAFELDKAVYEVVYETRHRPNWVPIPMGAIERLVG